MSQQQGKDKDATRRSTRNQSVVGTPASEGTFEDFVRSALTNLGTKLDTLITGQAALEEKVYNVEIKVQRNSANIDDIIKSVDFESNNIKDNATEIRALKEKLDNRNTELDRAKFAIGSLETELNALQRYTRGFNIRIIGMPESDSENCITSIQEVLKEKFGLNSPVIENAHRVGSNRGGKPRQVIARFFSRAVRRDVMTVAKKKLEGTGYRFVDDLTNKDLEEKRRLTPLMDELYRDNQRPRFVNGRLYANGRPVSREAINSFLATESGSPPLN